MNISRGLTPAGKRSPTERNRFVLSHPALLLRLRPRLRCATAELVCRRRPGRARRGRQYRRKGRSGGPQIEQVGKNVAACLDAGGATLKDIVFTVNYVTQPAEFEKYGDLRLPYFGPPTPQRATVVVPRLAEPHLLVQVEAFAAIK
jgi:hypothetical protein